jgi:hypothetical protein
MKSSILLSALAVAVIAGCSVQSAHAGDPCFFSGSMYSDGGASCQAGREYRCDDGEWLSTMNSCKTGIKVIASRTCDYSGIAFSTGSASCQNGTQFRCEDGSWRTLGVPCTVGDSPIKIIPTGSTCMFSGATVASGSTICQSGSTFLCNDGSWANLGTLCR